MEKNLFSFEVSCTFFDLLTTVDCGQSFRWEKINENTIHGVAFGKAVDISQTGNKLTFHNIDENDFETIWKPYFSLDKDYSAICNRFTEENIINAVKAYPGIRIMRQDPWEALCSFIISQNNNIPRIKGIISRLCEMLGDDLGNGDYSFPSPEKILNAGLEGLAPIRAGFRAKYIIDAASKVVDGSINFTEIDSMDLEKANEKLKEIKGVGDKVAQCVLLYGFNKLNAFPVDVWVKRIMAEMYPDGLPECILGYQGVAQQYLFHWRRNNE